MFCWGLFVDFVGLLNKKGYCYLLISISVNTEKKIRFPQSNFTSAINAYQGLNFNSNTVKMFTPDKVLLPNLGLYLTTLQHILSTKPEKKSEGCLSYPR